VTPSHLLLGNSRNVWFEGHDPGGEPAGPGVGNVT